MTDGRWIVIPKWDEFQHPDTARSGVPPWIKVYTRLLHNDAWLGLNPHERCLLLGVWLEYASAQRQLKVETTSVEGGVKVGGKSLSRRLNMRVFTSHLESLNDAGFIDFSASKPASNVQANLQAQKEKEKEKENPQTPKPSQAKPDDRMQRILTNALTVLRKTSIDNALNYVDNQPGLSTDQRIELEHHLRNGADG
jgi:hypothetical protein